ncbi:hypothetical protein L484_000503 [Morus notabilis]|uniref:Uncharacterized protein n=1 Tax=Morus notabilis TaxID=981085 RepID=W9SF78_9ROSA|nr:hypothetical protein L484_000503 [Morus notabilis]
MNDLEKLMDDFKKIEHRLDGIKDTLRNLPQMIVVMVLEGRHGGVPRPDLQENRTTTIGESFEMARRMTTAVGMTCASWSEANRIYAMNFLANLGFQISSTQSKWFVGGLLPATTSDDKPRSTAT